jgi:hypothetical protein
MLPKSPANGRCSTLVAKRNSNHTVPIVAISVGSRNAQVEYPNALKHRACSQMSNGGFVFQCSGVPS